MDAVGCLVGTVAGTVSLSVRSTGKVGGEGQVADRERLVDRIPLN